MVRGSVPRRFTTCPDCRATADVTFSGRPASAPALETGQLSRRLDAQPNFFALVLTAVRAGATVPPSSPRQSLREERGGGWETADGDESAPEIRHHVPSWTRG